MQRRTPDKSAYAGAAAANDKSRQQGTCGDLRTDTSGLKPHAYAIYALQPYYVHVNAVAIWTIKLTATDFTRKTDRVFCLGHSCSYGCVDGFRWKMEARVE